MPFSVDNGLVLCVLNTLRDCGLGAADYRLSNIARRRISGRSLYAENFIYLKRGTRRCRAYGTPYANAYSGAKQLGLIVRLWKDSQSGATCHIFTLFRCPKRRVASKI